MITESLLFLLQVGAVSQPSAVIRINQLGYQPDAPKVAVFCSLEKREIGAFIVTDERGTQVLEQPSKPAQPFGPCLTTYRLDFSSIKRAGNYRIRARDVVSSVVRIRADAYAGAADTLLYYMREQRSGYNPLFKTVVHTHDGIVVDDSTRAGKFVPVTGGWADASD
ncbi:MAG TPA: cellulase N-terminal Ig-like domain-containing protein, partial [Gemmatimonadaceae bacterium]|nr:cellulase N-terminal Ig-like domain-containing protein [Gemmatimonadaceae bacterium]